MAYNIYHGEHRYDRGECNLEDIAKLINKMNLDFVALQEVDSLTQRSANLNDGTPKDLVQTLARWPRGEFLG